MCFTNLVELLVFYELHLMPSIFCLCVTNALKMKCVMRADPQIRISDKYVQIVSTLNGS